MPRRVLFCRQRLISLFMSELVECTWLAAEGMDTTCVKLLGLVL